MTWVQLQQYRHSWCDPQARRSASRLDVENDKAQILKRARRCPSDSHAVNLALLRNNRIDSPGHLDILLIENDAATARLTKEAFQEAGLIDAVVSIPDGDEALSYLRQEDRYAGQPQPDIVFLDLHLPRKSGLEVLAEIKGNPKLRVTPVVVVSGSSNPQEIREAYELHASCYVRKPDDLAQFIAFAKSCYEFWGKAVIFPAKN